MFVTPPPPPMTTSNSSHNDADEQQQLLQQVTCENHTTRLKSYIGKGQALLKQMIKSNGRVLHGTNIVKVDSFINHQVDPELTKLMGLDMAGRFADQKVTKVLTLESSGIPTALMTALYLNVPLVYARKVKPSTIQEPTFSTKVKSFTKNVEYDVCVSSKYLNASDRVLIVDDFLAVGQATQGLCELIRQAGAELVGIGICIEKGFQEGGTKLRNKGIRLESLAIIEKFENDCVVFREE